MSSLKVDPSGCGPFMFGVLGFLLVPLGGVALFATRVWPGAALMVVGLILSTVSAYRFKEGRAIEGDVLRSPAAARSLFLYITYLLAAFCVSDFLEIDVVVRATSSLILVTFVAILVLVISAWVQRIRGLRLRNEENEE